MPAEIFFQCCSLATVQQRAPLVILVSAAFWDRKKDGGETVQTDSGFGENKALHAALFLKYKLDNLIKFHSNNAHSAFNC